MKITVKDLKQQKFTLDAEPEQTIGQLKENISKEKGWDASLQKLIYSGKVLQDTQTVESYNISEKGFVVCMVSKPKPPPASAKTPATPTSSSTTAATPAIPAAPVPAAAAASSTTGDAPATPSPAPAAGSTDTSGQSGNFNDPSALALGTQRDSVVQNMEAMGFDRADIDRAMRAAFYNPDRAVDYLLNGIPENVQQDQRQAAAGASAGAGSGGTGQIAASPPSGDTASTATAPADDGDAPINLFEAAAQAGQGGRGGGGGGGGAGGRSRGTGGAGGLAGLGGAGAGAGAGGGANLEFLRSNPQFQQLRQLVQQQPGMLEPILQQVGAGNPQLAQVIGENPEQFLQMLGEDIDDDAALPPGSQTISVTEEEREAIERLCRLGFERDLVIQAYFACDKNEELAANFLFDQPPEEDH